MAITWQPDRAGRWLFHCHMLFHISPDQSGRTWRRASALREPQQRQSRILGAPMTPASLGRLSLLTMCVIATTVTLAAQSPLPDKGHPDATTWQPLFGPDLSKAIHPAGVWVMKDGVLTASEDQAIWSDRPYARFVLDLEFQTSEGANSGVIVYAADTRDWIPNSVEIQILDDYSEKWSKAPKNWLSGAAFGRQPATNQTVRRPGEWNRMTILCDGPRIVVVLNGERVNDIDLTRFTSATTNPDGTEVPSWLARRPLSTLEPKGHIGLQGKHAGAPIYFRNVRIREL
jgi:hypothetical protein